jgi:hypothetical protein
LPGDPSGMLTVGDRLARIERGQDEMIRAVDNLARVSDVKDISARLTFIERDYVPQSSVVRYWRYIIAQSLVIIGMGITIGIFLVLRISGH